MPRNSLTLAVRVGCEIYRLAFLRKRSQLFDKCTFSAMSLFGRSRRCPIEAFTVYLLPRCFPIVLTFVGDSTITRYDIYLLLFCRFPPCGLPGLNFILLTVPSQHVSVSSSGKLLYGTAYLKKCHNRQKPLHFNSAFLRNIIGTKLISAYCFKHCPFFR